MNKRKNTSTVLVYGVLVFVIITCLFPIAWMCLISIKSTNEGITGFDSLMVSNSTMTNFKHLFEMIPVGQSAFNGVFATAMGAITSLFFCTLADSALAEYKFPDGKFLSYLIIITMLIPPEVGGVPLSIIIKRVGLISSLWSLVVPRVAIAVGTLYMNQYIADMSDELVEMVRIDECSDFDVLARITPSAIKPAMALWGATTLTARWNDFFWPLLCLGKQAKYTLMVTISLLLVSEGLSTPQPVILAGTILVIIPIIISYLILEEFQKTGIMESAVKG